MEPVRTPSSSGVRTSMVPSFEDSGHAGGALVPNAIWASLHAVSPVAADGSTVNHAGNVTDASRNGGVASVEGSSLWGTCMMTSNPVGLSAVLVSGCTRKEGSKRSRLQPVTGGDCEVLDAHAGSVRSGLPSALNLPGFCQESMWIW